MKKMRLATALLFATVTIFGGILNFDSTSVAFAAEADAITVYVDNRELSCDVPPFIENGRTMVPMRRIFEALGAEVNWNGDDQSILAVKESTEVFLQIGNATIGRNGENTVMDVVPRIVNNTTFVPLRAVSQSLDASVIWFGQKRCVYINSEERYAQDYDEAAKLYFAAIVPAGYTKIETTETVQLYENVCLYGKNAAVRVVNDTVYLVFETESSPTESAAVRIGEIDETDTERLREMLDGKTLSVAGTYVGLPYEQPIPTLYWAQIWVFETDTDYTSNELLYPDILRANDTVMLYDENNTPRDVRATRVSEYLEDGWSEEPLVVLYATDGDSVCVPQEDVALYREFGWYTEPTALVYAPDGRELAVPTDEVAAYQAVGWYAFPVMTVYAADGRSEVIAYDDFDAYSAVGWYESYEEACLAAGTYSYTSGNSRQDTSPSQNSRGLYRTPYGKCYHFDPDCGGKNSYPISWSQVGSLRPCQKCAR